MFALVLMNTSCEKCTDDNTPIPIAITTNNLKGDWTFASLKVGTKTYTNLTEIKNAGYAYGALSFRGITATSVDGGSLGLVDLNVSATPNVDSYTLSGSNINFRGFTFSVEYINSAELVFLLTKSTATQTQGGGNTAPIGGEYTLTKGK